MHTRTLLYSADNSIEYLTAPRRRISLTEGDTVYLTAPRSCRALTEGDRRGRDAGTDLAILPIASGCGDKYNQRKVR